MIDVKRLKSEIKLLSGQLKEHRKVIRDPIMNQPSNWKVHYKALSEARRKKTRVTKLCTLRALLYNKKHLSPSTRLEDHGLKSLSEEDLWKWVEKEKEEFTKKEEMVS